MLTDEEKELLNTIIERTVISGSFEDIKETVEKIKTIKDKINRSL